MDNKEVTTQPCMHLTCLQKGKPRREKQSQVAVYINSEAELAGR
jgi:hypothetical protein